jgi:hypothetical protein
MKVGVNAINILIFGYSIEIWIIFNYKIFELTLYNLGLILSLFPNHGVLVQEFGQNGIIHHDITFEKSPISILIHWSSMC